MAYLDILMSILIFPLAHEVRKRVIFYRDTATWHIVLRSAPQKTSGLPFSRYAFGFCKMRLTFSPSDSLPVQLLHGDSADGTMLRHTVIIAVKTSELVNINKKCPERIWSFNRATNVVHVVL